jgi:undecaprenyl-diphosphatase
MTFTQSVALGALQGATEFLPVSSSGHLAIAQYYLSGFSQPGILFDVLLHLGTMISVLIYFRRDVMALLISPWNRTPEGKKDRRLLWLLVLGSIPTGIIGLAGKDLATDLFHNMTVVGLCLLITGILLFICERFRAKTSGRTELSISDALVTGVLQGLAILPGISRSGSTIAGLLLRGVDGETAARFSFLLAMPAVFGATLLSLKDLQSVPTGELPLYAAGAACSLLVGLISIHFLLAIIRRRRLFLFALYCWAVGATILTLSMT